MTTKPDLKAAAAKAKTQAAKPADLAPAPRPRRLTSRPAVAAETLAAAGGLQTVGMHFGPTGLAVTTAAAAGAAGGGWALHKFAPGLASRLGLRKPDPTRLAKAAQAGRRAALGARGVLGSRVAGVRRPGGGLGVAGRRPGGRAGGALGRLGAARWGGAGGRAGGRAGLGRGRAGGLGRGLGGLGKGGAGKRGSAARSAGLGAKRPAGQRVKADKTIRPNRMPGKRPANARRPGAATSANRSAGAGRRPGSTRGGKLGTSRRAAGVGRTSSGRTGRSKLGGLGGSRSRTGSRTGRAGGLGTRRGGGLGKLSGTKRGSTGRSRSGPLGTSRKRAATTGKRGGAGKLNAAANKAIRAIGHDTSKGKHTRKTGPLAKLRSKLRDPGIVTKRNSAKPDTGPSIPPTGAAGTAPHPQNTQGGAMSGKHHRAKVVRPDATPGVAAPGSRRFGGIMEAANAPVEHMESATELMEELGGAAAATEAFGQYMKKFAEAGKGSVRLEPAMVEVLDNFHDATQQVSEHIKEGQQNFKRIHQKDWERLERGGQQEKAWDVSMNQR